MAAAAGNCENLRSFCLVYLKPTPSLTESGRKSLLELVKSTSLNCKEFKPRGRPNRIIDIKSDGYRSKCSPLSWTGPRTVIVPSTDQGFGFTLRHFIVYPPESATDDIQDGEIFTDENDPEGRRIKRTKLSSLEPMDTIFVKNVREDGPAGLAGLKTGDRIVSVNGETVTGKSYTQVISLIQSSGSALKLLVVPKDEDILQMAYQTSVFDKNQEASRGPSDSMMTSASQGNYVKIEHSGIAPTREVTVTSRRGGWREELRRKYSSPVDEAGYGSKADREAKSTSWQGSTTREPLRGDSGNNRNTDGRKSSFDIHISYNYPSGRSQPVKTSQQKSPPYGCLYYEGARGEIAEQVPHQARSNSTTCLSNKLSQEQESNRIYDYSRSYTGRSKDGLLLSPEEAWAPSYNSARSHTWDASKFSSRSAHGFTDSVPRSLTTSSLSKITQKAPENANIQDTNQNLSSSLKNFGYSVSSSSTTSLPQNTSPSRFVYYAPPKTSLQTPKPTLKATSADNLHKSYNKPNSLGSTYNSTSRLRDARDRTFVVRIGDKVTVSPSGKQAQTNSSSNAYPSGTTFALTKTLPQFESRKNVQLSVSERKKQFEASKRVETLESSPSPPSYEMSASTKRYKTELEKLQSLGKLGNIVTRVAHFEVSQSPSDSGGSTPTRTEQSPPPQPPPPPPSNNSIPQNNSSSSITQSQTVLQQQPESYPQQSQTYSQQQPQSYFQQPQSYSHPTQSYSHPPQSYAQPPQSYSQQPQSYSQPPQSYSQQPQSYSQQPQSYSQQPQSYSQQPQPYSQQPQSYSQQPQSYFQQPQSYSQQPQSYFQQPEFFSQEQQKLPFQPPLQDRTIQLPPQPAIKVRKIATERYPPSDSTSNRPTSLGVTLPIRVLIPQSTSAPNSPKVEERKSLAEESRTTSMRAVDSHGPSLNQPVALDSVEGTFLTTDKLVSNQSSNRPVRKVSYLTAVNAPICKQEDLTLLSASPQITVNGQGHSFDFDLDTGAKHDLDLLRHSVCTVTSQGDSFHKRSRSSFSFFSNATSGLLSAFSTLTAVMTASSENLERASDCKPDEVMTPPRTSSPNLSSQPYTQVVMRKKTEIEEEGMKLGRPTDRPTSYLMATRKDRTTLNLPLKKAAQTSEDIQISPSKNMTMKKLKNRFVEKTPRISEVSDSKELQSPTQELVKEGTLYCKTAITDGKRASDRSWKPVWASLKGHVLYLVRERKEGSWNANDEQLISIKSCLVDIANDYTKKKNVFRLKTYNGCEYLLQADDLDTMAEWIQAIQNNNDPDGDEKGVVMNDFMLRKTTQYEHSSHVSKTSPQTQQKSKKLSGLSFKAKMPYSPNIKRKKPPDEPSRSKTWKGKLKSIRRLGGGGGSTVEEEATPFGTFGVPLEECVPSPNNQYVPFIVDICTQIVELRGLEVVGIYRVPGNKAAVHMMQDELNRGFENMNTENEKWLDVNVISSLLKSFFRNLPDPLITEDLYQSFINANRADDPVKRMLSLKRLLHELPEHHFETFKHLAAHLKLVAMHGEQNKMDSRNLAIVFGPTLVRRKNEDMATLVKDMSDQCRIVESVIVNNEWIFSSWDRDNDVPVDDGTVINGPVSGSSQVLTKLTEDDRTREINPKLIVSSIIQAANKKLKAKDHKFLLGALDDDYTMECCPNERNIDQEVARRRARSEEILLQDTTSESTSTSSASKSFDNQDTMSLDHHDTYPFSLNSGTNQPELTDNFMDWTYNSASEPRGSLRAAPLTRQYFSDESLLDKNDELEISHGGLYTSCGQSRERLEDRLWSLEKEARDLREQAERGRREQEKRRLERQRIEQELARAKKELEMEDSHSLEDLLRHTEFSMQISDFPSRISELSGRPFKPSDSTSLLSEYSTTSSEPKDVKFYLPRSGTAATRTNPLSHVDRGQKGSAPQTSANNFDSRQSKRAGSLETIIDVKCNNGKRASDRGNKGKRGDGDRLSQVKCLEETEGKPVALVRSNSVRRGSLDSLRDFYDKKDQRTSWASTDSEDGSDLLSSITATFDQKLQILLNPKFKLTGAAKKLGTSVGPEESTRIPPAVKAVQPMKVEESKPAKVVLQKPVELTLPQRLPRPGEVGYDRSFRDPSLHRSLHRPDAKIGIASRFERGSSVNTSSIANVTVNQMSLSTSALPLGSHSRFYQSVPSKQDDIKDDGVTEKSSVPVRGEVKPFSVRPETRPITKSEKTEVNLSLSKSSREDGGGEARRYSDLNPAVCTGSMENLAYKPTQSVSAATPRRKDRRNARRHTVGGINDSEHLSAIGQLSYCHGDDSKVSAWEQLRPVVRESPSVESRSLITWLQKERLRMSASDLLAAENKTLSSSCGNLDETRC